MKNTVGRNIVGSIFIALGVAGLAHNKINHHESMTEFIIFLLVAIFGALIVVPEAARALREVKDVADDVIPNYGKRDEDKTPVEVNPAPNQPVIVKTEAGNVALNVPGKPADQAVPLEKDD